MYSSFIILLSILFNYTISVIPLNEYISSCENFTPDCIKTTNEQMQYYSNLIVSNLTDANSIPLISNSYYYSGLIDYLGLEDKKIKLSAALCKFIISTYLGNPKAQYKLYIIISSDMITHIMKTKSFAHIVKSNKNLIAISKTKFYENFRMLSQDDIRQKVAIEFLYASAIAKYNPAILTLGFKYKNGYGVEQSCENSIKYFKHCAFNTIDILKHKKNINFIPFEEIESIEEFEYVGYAFKEKKSIEDLIFKYNMYTEGDKGYIINEIGTSYLIGKGVEIDYIKAAHWFQLGEKIEHSVSLYYLGIMHLHGLGVERDFKKAYELFSMAIKQNLIQAADPLGYMYYYGLYVQKDIEKAYNYFLMTLKHGDDLYLNNALFLLQEHNEGKVPFFTDIHLANKIINYSTIYKYPLGKYLYAMMNLYNIGDTLKDCWITSSAFQHTAYQYPELKKKFNFGIKSYRDKYIERSFLIFLELAEQGNMDAIENVGILLSKYKLFEDNNFQKFLAFKYLTETIEDRENMKGYYTMLLLGDQYYNMGKYSKAIELYNQIIIQGQNKKGENFIVANAYYNLGLMACIGMGIKKNYSKAEMFFDLAEGIEDALKYPIQGVRLVHLINEVTKIEFLKNFINQIIRIYFSPGMHSVCLLMFVVFYLYFYIDIHKQKEIS